MQTDFLDGRIGIRTFRPEDVPLLFEAVHESLHELSQWMPWCGSGYSMDDSAAYVGSREAEFARGDHYSFVAYDLKNGELLGSVGINFVNQIHNFANLGYWVRSSRTCQGVATAATRLIAQFAFQELKFSRLEIVAVVNNLSSLRVAEKSGARREGILRNRLILHGKPQDAVMHSLTPEDLRA